MSDNAGFGYSDVIPFEAAATAIASLARALRHGGIRLHAAGQSIVLCPATVVTLTIEASSRGRKGKLAVTMDWNAAPANVAQRLSVTTTSAGSLMKAGGQKDSTGASLPVTTAPRTGLETPVAVQAQSSDTGTDSLSTPHSEPPTDAEAPTIGRSARTRKRSSATSPVRTRIPKPRTDG